MTPEINKIVESALQLPRENRAALAHQLLDSLLPEDAQTQNWLDAARESRDGFSQAMSPGLPADRLLWALGARVRT